MKKLQIVVLNFVEEGPVVTEVLELRGIRFEIQEHKIGWNFDLGEMLIRQFDGLADAIALSGMRKTLNLGKISLPHPGAKRLSAAAVETPLYYGEESFDFLTRWTLNAATQEQPQMFRAKKALFQAAVISHSFELLEKFGVKVTAADLLSTVGTAKKVEGTAGVKTFLLMLKPLMKWFESSYTRNKISRPSPRTIKTLKSWIKDYDIFVGYLNLLRWMGNLECLRGKVLIIDRLDEETKARLHEAGVEQVIELMPKIPLIACGQIRHFSVYAALVDLLRLAEDSPLSFDDYLLEAIQKFSIKPNRVKSTRGSTRRCAFVIHPLSQKYLWCAPGLKLFRESPEPIRNVIEKGVARLPIFHYGELRGAVSKATGQAVICDIYAILSTPKRLLNTPEEIIYNQLVSAAQHAQKRGALMMGLGAYTKIVGDNGITVAKRSPIPITTGNSYSAATTLWAAREILEKMAFIPKEKDGERFRAKAMIIGATGSIGRVSALLVSLICQEIVLVATSPDKLLELRAEIKKISPRVRIKITTSPNHELHDSDLIVTATSNQSGSILDISKVKPGAVICDCSRPLDISEEEAASRPDVMIIQSGEVLLPGPCELTADIGLPPPSVYACLAETVLLTMEGRYESFSLSKQLSMNRVKEIYKIGLKHGARLSEIQGHQGVITEDDIARCRAQAIERLRSWKTAGLKTQLKTSSIRSLKTEEI